MSKKNSRKLLRVVILTAIPLEYNAVRKHLKRLSEHQYNAIVYETGIFEGLNHKYEVLIAEVGMGNISAALGTEKAVKHFAPNIILFVGIAGRILEMLL